MGGLSREEYDALSNKDRDILNRRMRLYASQNPIETNAGSNTAATSSLFKNNNLKVKI